jgi:MFS family permease
VKASPRAVLAAAATAQAAVSLIGVGLPSIGPELSEEFELGLTALGAVLTVNLLGSGLFLVAAGVAVDRFGARSTTLLGTALGTGGLVGGAFAPSAPLLIAMLFLSGIGTSIIPIAGMSALFRAFPVTRRAWAMGVRQMAVPVGGVTAAVALPPLAHTGGARVALLFAAGMLGVLGTVFALTSDEAPLDSAARPRAELRRIVRLPGMWRLLVCAACFVVVLQAVLVYAVPASREAGLSRLAAAAVFFAIQVTAGVARVAWGRIADWEGGGRRARTLVEAGWVAAAGGVAFTLALHGGTAAVILAVILFAFGALGWNALVYVRAGEMAPPGLAGQAVSVAATVVFVVSAVATPPMGALAEAAGWDAFWPAAAALAACGALVAATLRTRPPFVASHEVG